MKRTDAMSLNMALHNEGLKVKFLSSSSYVELIGFKRTLQKYISEMVQSEQELFKAYEITDVEQVADIKKADKSFLEKLKAIQAQDFEPKTMNFIPIDEFKKFTDEVDFGPASILAEYLLKE